MNVSASRLVILVKKIKEKEIKDIASKGPPTSYILSSSTMRILRFSLSVRLF